MGRYDAQQVCLNGHQITDRFYEAPEFRQKHCPKCGAATVHACPTCGTDIKGNYEVDGVIAIGFSTPIPSHCAECGQAYPWTEKLHAAAEAVAKGDLGDAMAIVEAICTRFHVAVRQLRARHDGRPTLDVSDEYDVQDLLHALLVLFFDDVRAEEYTPSYAGRASRVDFLLRDASIVVEAKMTRKSLAAKEVGEELIIDTARYKTHPSCKKLVCLIYDPEGRIVNPRGLENDLNGEREGITVKVFIVPKGY